jgi:hypothetical protein
MRDRRGRFVKGRPGNPANRPRGCHDPVGHREDGNGSSLGQHAEEPFAVQ